MLTENLLYAGLAKSKAIVILSPSPNGKVACHMVEGKITMSPGVGVN